MATLPISTKTLQVGTNTFGPYSVGSYTQATIAIDRTVNGGLNSLTSATVLDLTVQSSPDGSTWSDEAEATFPGGIITDRHGQINTNDLTVNGVSPGATQVRFVANVSGPSAVKITGSLTVS